VVDVHRCVPYPRCEIPWLPIAGSAACLPSDPGDGNGETPHHSLLARKDCQVLRLACIERFREDPDRAAWPRTADEDYAAIMNGRHVILSALTVEQ
jgi:hypothetical protein